MTTTLLSSPPTTIPQAMPWISWAAVIAGSVVAIAVHLALTELCIGSGLASYEPADPQSSATAVASGTAIAWMVSGLISIFVGSWVAGRMKRHGTRIEAAVHGSLVWALGSILTLAVGALTLGAVVGGAGSLLSAGISGAGQGIAAIAPTAAKIAAPSWDDVKKQLDGAIGNTESAAGKPGNENRFAERSRLMQLLSSSFTLDKSQQSDAERQETSTLLASQLGISGEAARATLVQWQRVWDEGVQRYRTLMDDAKHTATEAAVLAKRRTSQAMIIAFFVMIAGLAAAMAGAVAGSTCVWTRAREEAGNPEPRSIAYA